MQFGYAILPIDKISIELIIKLLKKDISESGHLNDTSIFYLYLKILYIKYLHYYKVLQNHPVYNFYIKKLKTI